MKFKNEYYKNAAKEVLARDVKKSNISNEDAFIILIHGLRKEQLDNLCNALKDKLGITFEEAYNITQNKEGKEHKKDVLKTAIDIILSGGTLGTEVINGFNSSDFVNHCMREAILSYELATMLNLDSRYAFNYGLLHDYGRKYTHKFDHIVSGFEELYDLGLYDFAKASLTHSFINGGKYCNNERAKEGFKVDSNGKETYEDPEEYDDIYDVLSTSSYNEYDNILNLADLMATSYGIVSPEERINDIAKRRDGVDTMPNRKYFLATFTNMLIYTLDKMGIVSGIKKVDFNKLSLDEIKEEFKFVSKAFFAAYTVMKNVLGIEYKVEDLGKRNIKKK